jgi:hypothetical protein
MQVIVKIKLDNIVSKLIFVKYFIKFYKLKIFFKIYLNLKIDYKIFF